MILAKNSRLERSAFNCKTYEKKFLPGLAGKGKFKRMLKILL
jgi:hypothetical protein